MPLWEDGFYRWAGMSAGGQVGREANRSEILLAGGGWAAKKGWKTGWRDIGQVGKSVAGQMGSGQVDLHTGW